MMPKLRRVLGIDPGLGRMGWAVIDASGGTLTLVEAGCIMTPAKSNIGQRLVILYTEVTQRLAHFQPNVLAIEELFFTNNVTTGIDVGQARGVALLATAEAGIPVLEFTPTRVKQGVTGYGRADKKQMHTMVKLLLKLKTMPATDDAVDAIAIAICGAQGPIKP